ncbi:MAG: hypothetical protein IH994_06005 [Proteobacteria bacterium]|nr:hypothetical protein [Pseudomonadota bacterium]
MKFCKDCRHIRIQGSGFAASAVCGHEKAARLNPVTGTANPWACLAMRGTDDCGPEAKLFEPKEQEVEAA